LDFVLLVGSKLNGYDCDVMLLLKISVGNVGEVNVKEVMSSFKLVFLRGSELESVGSDVMSE
jgi:hypothetical protein